MKRTKRLAITAGLMIVCVFLGFGVVQLFHGTSQQVVVPPPPNSTANPTAGATASGVPMVSPGVTIVLPANFKAPTVLPSGLSVFDENNATSSTNDQAWAISLVRSEALRAYGLSSGQAGMETALTTNPSLDLVYGPAYSAMGSGKATVTGEETDYGISIEALSASEASAVANYDGGTVVQDALLLTVGGPYGAVAGGKTWEFAPAVPKVGNPRTILFAGLMVDSPTLGLVWQSALIYPCHDNDIATVETCLP